jgi:4-carboxymuconolactone decarboxylase
MVQSRDQLAAEYHEIYDAITASRGHATGPWALLLNSPVLASRTAQLGAYLRFEGILDDASREILILATARAVGCRYEWADHAPIARQAGLSENAIHAIRDRNLRDLPDDIAKLVSVAEKLANQHSLDEDEVSALQDRFGVQGVLEVAATVGYYTFLGTLMNAFGVEPDPSRPDRLTE